MIKIYKFKNEILGNYTGEFELVGKLPIGDQIRQNHIRFRNSDDYVSYINAINATDWNFESEDAIFNGYIYNINTLQFSLIFKSQYGNGCDFKQEIFEYRRKKYFIPTKGYHFVKCISFITGEDYKQQNLDFLRDGKNDQIL